MSSVRSGILSESFDPVCSGHIRFSLEKKTENRLDRVFLILQPSGNGAPCRADLKRRWIMLVTSCASDKCLVPLLMKDSPDSLSFEDIFVWIRKEYPEDVLVPLTPKPDDDISRNRGYVPDPELLCPSVREYCSLLGLYGGTPSVPEAAEWMDMLFQALTPHRFAHSLAVAMTSKQLAVRYGIDETKAEKAGLLHDCAKCLPLSEMQSAVRKKRLTNDPLFLSSGALLHSLAGAAVAEDKYRMMDPEILEAIAYHNTGFPGMSPLAMCVCLADYIEPNREPFPGLEEIRSEAEVSMEKALLLGLERTAAHICSKGKKLHPRTLNTIAWLKTLPAVRL